MPDTNPTHATSAPDQDQEVPQELSEAVLKLLQAILGPNGPGRPDETLSDLHRTRKETIDAAGRAYHESLEAYLAAYPTMDEIETQHLRNGEALMKQIASTALVALDAAAEIDKEVAPQLEALRADVQVIKSAVASIASATGVWNGLEMTPEAKERMHASQARRDARNAADIAQKIAQDTASDFTVDL